MEMKHQCAYPGCHELISSGKYCSKHKPKNEEGDSESKYAYMYKTVRWVRESKRFLMEHPWCEKCGRPAQLVHHWPEHHGDVKMFWDKSTWHPLCKSCHSRMHMTEVNNRGRKKC